MEQLLNDIAIVFLLYATPMGVLSIVGDIVQSGGAFNYLIEGHVGRYSVIKLSENYLNDKLRA